METEPFGRTAQAPLMFIDPMNTRPVVRRFFDGGVVMIEILIDGPILQNLSHSFRGPKEIRYSSACPKVNSQYIYVGSATLNEWLW